MNKELQSKLLAYQQVDKELTDALNAFEDCQKRANEAASELCKCAEQEKALGKIIIPEGSNYGVMVDPLWASNKYPLDSIQSFTVYTTTEEPFEKDCLTSPEQTADESLETPAESQQPEKAPSDEYSDIPF